jgi:hypothetical protein
MGTAEVSEARRRSRHEWAVATAASGMDNVHIVTLGCHHCHGEHLHEVTYAGRLLASTLCSNCGHRITKDLSGLPGTLLLKPAKMEGELPVLPGSR